VFVGVMFGAVPEGDASLICPLAEAECSIEGSFCSVHDQTNDPISSTAAIPTRSAMDDFDMENLAISISQSRISSQE
jgi:hypothetical protein